MHEFVVPITVGILVGIFARISMIQRSYRQFPSQPHGLIIHLFLGAVASLLGSLVIPAILKPDFTAGVFVSIGTAQFHAMRDLERKAWLDLDKGEPIPRGSAYIDGMATAFEARIFLVMGLAGMTTLASHLLHPWLGALLGVVLTLLVRIWKQGRTVRDLAQVRIVQAQIEENWVIVEGERIQSLHVGRHASSDQKVLAIAVELNDFSGVLTFAHHGQQQALLHNVSVTIGVYPDAMVDPTIRFLPKQRKLILVVIPIVNDEQSAVASVAGTPVLEGIYRKQMIDPAASKS